MNFSETLKKALSPEFFKLICKVGENADKYGVNAYIVGGVVRDLLLSMPIFDIDFVIEGDAIDFCQFLQTQNECKLIKKVENFGTAKVCFNFASSYIIDFASTRTENYPKPGHLPVVREIGCSLKEDIFRRDFSVNAIAIKINLPEFGKIIDFTGGLIDIEKKELRVLHDKSFLDDPTRIIRGLRFCHKLGFKLNEETQKLQDKYLSDFNSEDICYERIKQVIKLAFNLNSMELFNDFSEKNFYKILSPNKPLVKGENLFKAIEKNKKHIPNKNIWLVYLSAFLPTEEAIKFNLSSKALQIIEGVNNLKENTYKLNTNYEIYNFFKNTPIESIVAYSASKNTAAAQKYLDELKDIKPALSGNDLINLGLPTGKIIGEIFDKILELKLNGKLQTKDEELNFVKQFLNPQ